MFDNMWLDVFTASTFILIGSAGVALFGIP
jgi:hypothetical protein